MAIIKNPTIVMALYDIGRDNWNHFNLSYNTYLAWMKNSLSFDANFVIYTEDKFYDTIKANRLEFDPDFSKTVLIKKPLEELKSYVRLHEKLKNLMFSDDFLKKVHSPDTPEMSKPLYNVIMFNKLDFLKETKDAGYFNNDFLIWADAGGLREDISNYRGKKWPDLDKVNGLDNSKITFFSHTSDFYVENAEYHSLSQIRNIQGTAFFVPTKKIDALYEEFNKTIDECLENGFIGSDEKVFDLTYLKDKNNYHLIKCDWRQYYDIFKSEDPNELRVFKLDDPNEKRKILLDLGSHECQGLNRLIGNLKIDHKWLIYSFEPNPLVGFDECVSKLSHLNVIPINGAVWTKDGMIKYNQYGSDGKSQGGLIEDSNGGKYYGDFYSSTNVKSIDLHKFIVNLGNECEIYIKMDIEWSEFMVLDHLLMNGWPKTIKKIWIEWHNINDAYYKSKSEFLIDQIKINGTEVDKWN